MTVFVRSEDIANEIKARLSAIRIGNPDCETDIGVRLQHGRRKVPADDELPCVQLVEGNDDMDDAAGRTRSALVKVRQAYVIDAFDKCDPNNPNVKAHAMIRDIKRAIFAGDSTLGGKVREVKYLGRDIGPRPDGVALVQVRVIIGVEYVENLTNP